MFFNVIASIAVTAPILAAPTPDDLARNGMAIPLTKYSSLLNSNKNIYTNALNSHVAEHTTKIIHGIDDFERNTVLPHLSTVKREGSSGFSVDLTNYDGDMWYGTILIGTPTKSFTVQFDTGSSDLFVPVSTGDENCRSHLNLWDPTSSLTSKALGLYFGMIFGDDAAVKGEQYTDIVTIGGFTADIQTIGAATTYSSQMAASEFTPDGILGLAFPSLSSYPASPLFQTLFSEGKLPQPLFSLKLTASGGELYIGGMNEALYIDSSLTFTPVTNPRFWELNIDNIKVNDKIVLKDVPAIIDTGANFVFGDTSRVLALHQEYGGKAFENGYYTFPCSSFPSVTFTIGGNPFLIPAHVLNQGRVTSGSRDCFSGILFHEKDYDSWTIGTIFLQRFYTVFDFSSKSPRVGFAKLART